MLGHIQIEHVHGVVDGLHLGHLREREKKGGRGGNRNVKSVPTYIKYLGEHADDMPFAAKHLSLERSPPVG